MSSLEVNLLLRAAADACDSRKAEDIRILALDQSESALTDYFLICSGTNERQNVAISDEIEARLKKEFETLPNSVEGRRQGEWVLMDYVDFVVHIFLPEKRAYYGLEQLRKSATTLDLNELDQEIKAALLTARAKQRVPRPDGTAPSLAATADVAALQKVRSKPASTRKASAKRVSTQEAGSISTADSGKPVAKRSGTKRASTDVPKKRPTES